MERLRINPSNADVALLDAGNDARKENPSPSFGEGRVKVFSSESEEMDPHPSPLPAYRERGPESSAPDCNCVIVTFYSLLL